MSFLMTVECDLGRGDVVCIMEVLKMRVCGAPITASDSTLAFIGVESPRRVTP